MGTLQWDMATGEAATGARHTDKVGLNPYRKHRRRRSDYVLVGACLAVVLALLVWAFLG